MNGCGQVCDGDGHVLDDVFGDGMFVRYYECIGGATMVCDKPLMQWYIVV